MASVLKRVRIDVAPEVAWDALRDWGAVHLRLAPGFATDSRLDGEDRIVTFGSGTVLRERLIDCNDKERRLAWAIVDGPYTHHNGVAEIRARADGTTDFIWTADVLPHNLAEPTAQSMTQGLEIIRNTLERG